MLTTIYYSLAIVAYSIFLIQFIISVCGGTDIDMDIDFDGDGIGDMSWGDIFSFKGIIHFLMGFAGWLSLISYTGTVVWYDYLIAIALGIVFVVVLMYVGLLLLRLKHEPAGQTTQDYLGHKGVISIVSDEENAYYVTMQDFGGYELKVYSNEKYKLGDEVIINSYTDGKYFI